MRTRLVRVVLVGAFAALLAALVASSGKASTGGLGWKWPNRVTSGTPVSVASLDPCPAVPTSGDMVIVQITLTFGTQGASAEDLFANADGSWSGAVTFNFSGVGRKATISAECLDYNPGSFVATSYAQYAGHLTMLSG